jgi:hypothetical protein
LEELVREWGVFLGGTEDYLRNQEDIEDTLNAKVKYINALRRHIVNICLSEGKS